MALTSARKWNQCPMAYYISSESASKVLTPHRTLHQKTSAKQDGKKEKASEVNDEPDIPKNAQKRRKKQSI